MYLSQFITEKEKLHATPEQGLIYNECGSRRVLVCLPDFKSGSSSKRRGVGSIPTCSRQKLYLVRKLSDASPATDYTYITNLANSEESLFSCQNTYKKQH